MYTLQGHVLQPAVRPQKPIGSSARHAHACADDPRESKSARPGSGACALLVGSLLSYAPAHVQPSLASLACGQQQGAELPLTLQGRRGCSLPPFVSSILSPSRMRMRHPARMAVPGPEITTILTLLRGWRGYAVAVVKPRGRGGSVSLRGSGTSRGTTLHSGHDARPFTMAPGLGGWRPLVLSQSSMQARLKLCPHGRVRISSPS